MTCSVAKPVLPPPPPNVGDNVAARDNGKLTKTHTTLERMREKMITEAELIRLSLGKGFNAIKFAPGSIVVVGGAEKSAKTTLVSQLATDALIHNPDLSCLYVTVEVSTENLLQKQ